MKYTENLIEVIQRKVNDKRYYYSQNRENQFATDCSWLIITSISDVGLPVNGATYTGNMVKELSATGKFKAYPFRYTDLQRGDILVKHISDNNGHAVIYIGNGEILEACNKKYGLRRCKYYANGYQYILRLTENIQVTTMKQITKGDKGIEVAMLQMFLNKYEGNKLIIDGDYGIKTSDCVRTFQAKYTLEVDNIVGVKTWGKIYSIMVHA